MLVAGDENRLMAGACSTGAAACMELKPFVKLLVAGKPCGTNRLVEKLVVGTPNCGLLLPKAKLFCAVEFEVLFIELKMPPAAG